MSAGHEESFGLSLNQLLRRAEIDWHGVQLGRPDWSDSSHSLALTVRPRQRQIPLWLHVMFNAYWEALDFELPLAPGTALAGWQRWIDTSLKSPEDIDGSRDGFPGAGNAVPRGASLRSRAVFTNQPRFGLTLTRSMRIMRTAIRTHEPLQL